MILQIMFVATLIATGMMAFRHGRYEERQAAIVMLLAALASPLVETNTFVGMEIGILLIDGSLLAYLLVLAMRSDRLWPMWAAGFQIVGTAIHGASVTDATIWPFAYATAQVFWSYPVLFALMFGSWVEARHRAY
jgi:hypothetical protein